jgi:hypothetical protein
MGSPQSDAQQKAGNHDCANDIVLRFRHLIASVSLQDSSRGSQLLAFPQARGTTCGTRCWALSAAPWSKNAPSLCIVRWNNTWSDLPVTVHIAVEDTRSDTMLRVTPQQTGRMRLTFVGHDSLPHCQCCSNFLEAAPTVASANNSPLVRTNRCLSDRSLHSSSSLPS